MGENSLPGLGLVILMKRSVRTRMQGVVGAGGLKPPATRLDVLRFSDNSIKIDYHFICLYIDKGLPQIIQDSSGSLKTVEPHL